jgi:hypothetical protein
MTVTPNFFMILSQGGYVIKLWEKIFEPYFLQYRLLNARAGLRSLVPQPAAQALAYNPWIGWTYNVSFQ